MNRRLAETVITVFQNDTKEEVLYALLAAFSERTWLQNCNWLDASGLALYFLRRIKELHVEGAVPVKFLQRLEKNAADNRDRSASMFAEFIKINKIFLDADLTYINLKGFTLIPDACSDAALRCQFDLDFSLLRSDLSRCEKILEEQGYRLSGIGNDVREYKSGSQQLPQIKNLYKASSQYSLEIHLVDPTARDMGFDDGRLSTVQQRSWNGLMFPALRDSDRFVSQALHIFKHLRGEWTRVSWILEYVSSVTFHREHDVLWVEVSEISAANSEVRLALGAVTLIADKIFGITTIPSVLTWAVKNLPASVRLWVDHYGKRSVMAQFPGTKLYLLLYGVLEKNDIPTFYTVGSKLFPLRSPRRIVGQLVGEGWWQRFGNVIIQYRYSCFRLWFHLVNGVAYLLEAQIWKRRIARELV
jgi:hypothetical protein